MFWYLQNIFLKNIGQMGSLIKFKARYFWKCFKRILKDKIDRIYVWEPYIVIKTLNPDTLSLETSNPALSLFIYFFYYCRFYQWNSCFSNILCRNSEYTLKKWINQKGLWINFRILGKLLLWINEQQLPP